jgi:hypothetical protein
MSDDDENGGRDEVDDDEDCFNDEELDYLDEWDRGGGGGDEDDGAAEPSGTKYARAADDDDDENDAMPVGGQQQKKEVPFLVPFQVVPRHVLKATRPAFEVTDGTAYYAHTSMCVMLYAQNTQGSPFLFDPDAQKLLTQGEGKFDFYSSSSPLSFLSAGSKASRSWRSSATKGSSSPPVS